MEISCVLKPVVSVVSFMRGHGHALNRRQFLASLEELDLTSARWLNCGNVLCCFHKLHNIPDVFLTKKDRAD